MSENKETMLTYIDACPAMIRQNVGRSAELTKPLVDEYTVKDYKTIWIVASGSSYNGSHCARYFIRNTLKTEVKVVTPFAFIHAENNVSDDDFVFVVSQSGYSTNSIEACDVLRSKGKRTISISTNVESDMKDHSDLIVDYGIGNEKVHYVTLGVTGFATFLMLFATEAALVKGLITAEEADAIKAEMLSAADVNAAVLEQTKKFYNDNFLALTSIGKTFILGLGSGYGIALEGALKISETVQIPVLPLEAEEYLHGITLQLNPRATTFVIDNGLASARMVQIYEANKLATANTFFITTNSAYKNEKTAVVVDTDVRTEIMPLCYLPFFQYIAYKVTDDTDRWQKHPAFQRMDKVISAKTEKYLAGV